MKTLECRTLKHKKSFDVIRSEIVYVIDQIKIFKIRKKTPQNLFFASEWQSVLETNRKKCIKIESLVAQKSKKMLWSFADRVLFVLTEI